MFSGTAQMVHAFELRPLFDGWWAPLVSGLRSVGFGVATLYYYPTLSLAFAVAWEAWWLLFTGALAIYGAVAEHRIGASWGWTAAFGVLAVICGELAILTPPATLAALMGLMAGFAIGGRRPAHDRRVPAGRVQEQGRPRAGIGGRAPGQVERTTSRLRSTKPRA
jgi:uncharacterized membrane protein HdeD (DUF308 family)